MARPKIKEAKKQYTVMLRPSVVEEIDKLSKKLELSRSQLMSNLIDVALEDAKLLYNIGVLKLVMMGGKLANKLKIDFLSGKADVDDNGNITIKE
jgi:hypothetical protein